MARGAAVFPMGAVSHVRSGQNCREARRAGMLRAAVSLCAGMALVYLALTTGTDERRQQLAESQAMISREMAAARTVRKEESQSASQNKQKDLGQVIRDQAEMHAAEMIRKMEVAKPKKTETPSQMAQAKTLGMNMPEHHGVTPEQYAIEQREMAEEARENEESTAAVLPAEISHPKMAKAKSAGRPVFAARYNKPMKPTGTPTAQGNVQGISNIIMAKAMSQIKKGESSFSAREMDSEKHAKPLSTHEIAMEKKMAEEDERENESFSSSVMVTDKDEQAEENAAKERLAHREEKYHQAIANEARQQASVDNAESALLKMGSKGAALKGKSGAKETGYNKLYMNAFKKATKGEEKNLDMLIAAKKQEKDMEAHIESEINAITGSGAPKKAAPKAQPVAAAPAKPSLSAHAANAEAEAEALAKAKASEEATALRAKKMSYMAEEQRSLKAVRALDEAKAAPKAAVAAKVESK